MKPIGTLECTLVTMELRGPWLDFIFSNKIQDLICHKVIYGYEATTI
jgi:hypothetical protein